MRPGLTMTGDRAAYEALMMRVEKPGRYLGNERGMVRKELRAVSPALRPRLSRCV